jgi:thioredoxin reductase (NADPH)
MYDLIIIGAGPAGLTAGLYAGRYRLNTLILEKTIVGGQIITSTVIENFPGFEGGSTLELIENMAKQVKGTGVNIVMEEVTGITASHRLQATSYQIKTQQNTYEAQAVIIASGAGPRRLGIEGEERLTGRGVSYCGTCDAPLFAGKEIVVIGGGDRAIEEAIFLAGYAKKVSLIHRRIHLRGSNILQERARLNKKIVFVLQTVVEEIRGQNKVEAVRIRHLNSGIISELPCEGVFIFVGINPNTDFCTDIAKDKDGFILTSPILRTSKEGIFACGDCIQKSLRQVVTACADGATAACSVKNYLENLRNTDFRK